MKKSFSHNILAACVATLFAAPHAWSADPQIVRNCTHTDNTSCHYTHNNPNNTPQWQHYHNYFDAFHNGAPLQKQDLASNNLKVVVSGNVKNQTTNSVGIKPSSLPNNSFDKHHDDVVYVHASAAGTAELAVLPETVATLSMQPEDSAVVYVGGDTTATLHKNARLIVNPSYAEVNQLDMTQYDEAEKSDYNSGQAIDLHGEKAKVINSADIELNGRGATGVRLYDNSTAQLSNHSIQLNGNWTSGFDTLNKGKITADNISISGSGEVAFAFSGDNIHLNHSTVNLSGKTSFVTDNNGGDETTITQNINNSSLSAAYGILLANDEEDKYDYILNLQNSSLSGRTALLVAQPENIALGSEGDAVGNITLNADNSTLSGASVLNNQTANAVKNRNITLNLNNNSIWTIQNSSEIDNLKLDNATVKIGKENGYNELKINGNLSGNGAFHLNSDIAGNQADLLNVTGAVSGSHVLHIANTATEPQSTDGKLTVVKTGSSGADAFKLGNDKGVVAAGKYLYALQQNGTNWQLVYNNTQQPENTTQPAQPVAPTPPSQPENTNQPTQPTTPPSNSNTVAPTTPVAPSTPVTPVTPTTPVAPTTPTTPVVDKNFRYDLAGSLAHAQAAALSLQTQSQALNAKQLALHQNQRLHGLWLQGETSRTERKNSQINGGNASGFKDKTNTWQIGFDKEMGNGYAGLLAGQIRHDVDYHIDLYDNSKIRGNTFALYGGLHGTSAWFADGTLRHTRYAASNPQFSKDTFRINSLNIQGGKNIALNETWTAVPNAALTVGRLSGSSLIQNGNLLQTQAGIDVQGKFVLQHGVLFQPKAGVYYVGDHRGVNVQFNGENFRAPHSGSRVALKLGADVSFNKNNVLNANFRTEHGSQSKRPYAVDLGFRHAW